MSGEALKLTNYFGERDRAGRQFVADALLGVYGRHRVATSILLRGNEGFGLTQRLRSDRLLTLSEDLPLVSVAVDRRERIESLLGEVTAIEHHGLLTLERARISTASAADGGFDVNGDDATKLTVYLGRGERAGGRPAPAAVCDLLHRRGFGGATVLLGVDGTAHGQRRRARFLGSNAGVPVMVIAVGAHELVAGALGELDRVLERPLWTLERVSVCKRDGELVAPPPAPVAGDDEHGLAVWQKLMIHSSESARHEGAPLHTELVRRLRAAGGSGATCLRGVWGFHGDHPPHGDRLFQIRRHVPVLTIVVDTPQRIAAAFQIVDQVTCETGLVTSEIVPAMAASAPGARRGGLELAPPRR